MYAVASGSVNSAVRLTSMIASSENAITPRAPQNRSSGRALSNAAVRVSGFQRSGRKKLASKRPTAGRSG